MPNQRRGVARRQHLRERGQPAQHHDGMAARLDAKKPHWPHHRLRARLRVAEGSHSRPALSARIGVLAGPALPVADGELEPPCVPRARDGARPRHGRAHYPQSARLSCAAWPSWRRRLLVVNFRTAHAPHRIRTARGRFPRRDDADDRTPVLDRAGARDKRRCARADAKRLDQGARHPKALGAPRSYGLIAQIDEDGDVIESLHSRVGGRCHGVTAACETAQGLVIISKGHGQALLDTSGAKP